MNKHEQKLVNNFVVFLLGSFGSKAMSILLIPLYTAFLSTAEYGVIDIINTTVALLLPISTLGLIDAIFRFTMGKDYHNNQVISVGFYTSMIIYLTVTFLCICINKVISWKYMYLMLLQLLATMVYNIFSSYLKAMQMSKKYVAVGMLQTFLSLSLNIIFLVVMHWKIEGYILAATVSLFAPSFFIIIKERVYKKISPKYFEWSLLRKMLFYSIPLIFSSLSWWIISSVDRYMILYFYGEDAVGLYSVASKIPLILQTIILILQTVWQISTNEIYEEDRGYLGTVFETFSGWFQNVGYILGSLLLMFSPILMKVLAQKDFYEGWIYAPFLIFSTIFPFSAGMTSSLYGAYQKNKGMFVSVVTGAFINIIINALLIPKIGIMGATIATAISRCFISMYALVDTEKLLRFNRHYGRIILNDILILLQILTLISLVRCRYSVQFVFFCSICILNREILIISVRKMVSLMEGLQKKKD